MKRVCACLLLSLIPAFAGRPVPMLDKKAVEIEAGFLGSRYRQESQLLQPGSMYEVLATYPEAKGLSAASKGWMYPGLALGGAALRWDLAPGGTSLRMAWRFQRAGFRIFR